MDGITAVSQRVAGIQTMIERLSTLPPPAAAASVPAGTDFTAVLDQAMGHLPPAGAPVPQLSTATAQPWLDPWRPPWAAASAAVAGPGAPGSAVVEQTGSAGAPPVGLNADGVPADLAVYGNGHVPASALEPVGTTHHRLWRPAATALEDLLAAARADGIDLGINDTYRSYDRQVKLAGELGLYGEGGLAAVPGTSDHGWGMAVDLGLSADAQAWMRANAGRFGYVDDVSGEPWHWAFKPAG